MALLPALDVGTHWQERARWPHWTPSRRLAAFGLVGASLVVTAAIAAYLYFHLVLGFFCGLAGFCSPDQLDSLYGRLHRVLAAVPVVLLAGPATVAWLRRRPLWVVAPTLVLALTILRLIS